MTCEHCGCVFCWDGADQIFLGSDRKRFCSRACKTNANKRPSQRGKWRNYRSRKACEERQKLAYDSKEEALHAIGQLRRFPPLYPYRCRCGSWHLTSQEPRPEPDDTAREVGLPEGFSPAEELAVITAQLRFQREAHGRDEDR